MHHGLVFVGEGTERKQSCVCVCVGLCEIQVSPADMCRRNVTTCQQARAVDCFNIQPPPGGLKNFLCKYHRSHTLLFYNFDFSSDELERFFSLEVQKEARDGG
mmetsp:Transcript_2057/g.2146  ORF Transcript_2057/g.2146 Transcript_2057/m.2146 type:complete len:103 (-) Transcript_2057:58-366(-)